MKKNIKEKKQYFEKNLKTKFFAQYWGQFYEFKNTKTKFRVNEGAFPLEEEGNERLILIDIRNILDEDVIIISKKFGITILENLDIESKMVIYNSNANVIDFLRSKGYLVPFMQYSVDDLILFGWVRLV